MKKVLNSHIPVFFSTDNEYIPYLDVAISSLYENASKEYSYRIIVLNTGLDPKNIEIIKKNEREGLKIDFIDISECIEDIKDRLKNVYHFSVVTYYRIFIASLFPEYDKILYLDCDLVVLGDISKLYNIELGSNILAATPDQFVQNTREFRTYAEKVVGVDPDGYFNAGVLLLSLEQFRKNDIEKKFIELITKYDFDLLDPDQAYLNYLCANKTHLLPNGWNKTPNDIPCQGEKNIVHYALYKKPWEYNDVIDGEYFWEYAKKSPFYDLIVKRRDNFDENQKALKDAVAKEILLHANKIIESDYTFSKKLCRN